MNRMELPLRGWDTVDPVQSRLRNMRLMNGVLTPRPKPVQWVGLAAGQSLNANERFSGIASFTKEDTPGVLGKVLAAMTTGYPVDTADEARLWLKRFSGDFTPSTLYPDDLMDTNEVSSLAWARLTPNWLTLGDLAYLNMGTHFLDLLASDAPTKCFQCDPDVRNPDPDMQEYHQFQTFAGSWVEGDETGIASHAVDGNGVLTITTNATDFTFSFLASADIPPSTFELPFFISFTGVLDASQLAVQFYDSAGEYLAQSSLADYERFAQTPQSTQQIDLTNPTSIMRRSVFLNPRDFLALGKKIRKIKFSGNSWTNPSTLAFQFASSGGADFNPDGWLVLPPSQTLAALTYGSNVVDLPPGVGVASELQIVGSPQVLQGNASITRDGFDLSTGVIDTLSATAAINDYYASQDLKWRDVPIEEETITDVGVTLRYARYFDLFDDTLGRCGTYKGWAFPHLENAITPLILSAAFWNGRLAMATSDGKLWLSDPADSFAFGGDSDGGILDLPSTCFQLISPDQVALSLQGGQINTNTLFLVCQDGIHVLTGEKGAWRFPLLRLGTGKATQALDGTLTPEGFSKSLLLMSDGAWSVAGEEITHPIRPEVDDANILFLEWDAHHRGFYGTVQEADTGARYVWFLFEGSWSKDVFDLLEEGDFHCASYLPGEGMVYAFRDGLYKLTGLPTNDWEWSFDVRFPENSKVHRLQLEGTGKCQMILNNLAASAQEVELPFTIEANLLQPEAQKAEATVTLSGVDVTGSDLFECTRVWIEFEPLATAQGGKV